MEKTDPRLRSFVSACALGTLLVASAFVVVLGNNASQSALAGTFPGTNGKIAFVSSRDGNDEIYVMNPDGSGQQRLTNNAAFDSYPSWSPDGARIAFTSSRDGKLEIYVMNGDGTNQVRLTNDGSSNVDPTWSPDGTKIAFVKSNSDIIVMNSDGTNQVGLTTGSGIEVYGPSWSPDGSKIAFSCYDGNSQGTDLPDLCMIDSDGSDLRPHFIGVCTDNGDWDPSWSPDGSQIAFTSRNRDTGCDNDGSGWGQEILVLNLATSSWIDIMADEHDEYGPNFEQPSWSPDGTKIAFSCTFACIQGMGVYVVNADGSHMQKLPSDTSSQPRPDWGRAISSSYSALCDNPTISGTDGNDVITGTDGPNTIDGMAGDDVINGLGGDDIICGGDGNDKIYAGDGNDIVFAGAGDDVVYGGGGYDQLYGGHGNDVLRGGQGNDIITGGSGNDYLYGNADDDKLYGSSGNDFAHGGAGNDYVDGGTGNDYLDGGEDYDYLDGAAGKDTCARDKLSPDQYNLVSCEI